MTPSSSRELWSEFDWEKELRKDDERVRTYLQELPRFIDLPQEDAMILKRIQRREELIPHGGVWPFREPWDRSGNDPDPDPEDAADDSDDGDDRAPRGAWTRREGADVYVACGKLSRALCMIFAMDPPLAQSEELIQALAYLGKIMARLNDMIDLYPGELPALRIALCKRILSDLNEMFGLLDKLRPRAGTDESAGHLDYLSSQFRLQREKVLDLLERARNPRPPSPDGGDDDSDDGGDGYDDPDSDSDPDSDGGRFF